MLDWRFSRFLLLAAPLLLLSQAERTCPAGCRCEGKIVYCESGDLQGVPENMTAGCQGLSLRYNNLLVLLPYQFAHLNQLVWLYLDHNQILIRTFLECRSLEFLDLGYNRLRSLTRTTFLGLFRLRELHLDNLHKLDLSGNEIQTLDAAVFQCMPNLRTLNLESNKLSSVPVEAVAAWTSLGAVSLAGNAWDCTARICPLIGWLTHIWDSKDISMICSSPRSVQGERVVDVVRNHSTCADALSTTALTATLSPSPAGPTATTSSRSPPTSPVPELQFEHVSFHKIMAGVALFLSVSLILLVVLGFHHVTCVCLRGLVRGSRPLNRSG
uniref:Uncharacterized protein n=1 Tax=Mola mola TaxID=94237 RepID=A0A3Q4B7U7_MOLML